MKTITFTAIFAAAVVNLQAYFFFSPELIQSNLKTYSDEERAEIEKDLAVVKGVCFPEKLISKERPVYVASAGAPGSRKTTILEKFLKTEPGYSDCLYLDPDPRSLKYMVHTYLQSLTPYICSQSSDYDSVIRNAYNKWRFGSTYICASLLEEAFQNRCDVAHGTTLTGDVVPSLLRNIKEAGYEITLLLCSADDEFRKEAIRYRNEVQRFYQSSPEDAASKGKFFPQKMETYFKFADKMHFYWSDALDRPERLAAKWTHGELTIVDEEAWMRFVQKYENDRASLLAEGKTIPPFAELLHAYAQ